MIGRKFSFVEVLERVSTPKGKSGRRGPYYRCKCHRCGQENYVVTSGDLFTGRIKSCGCYRLSQEFADAQVQHGHRRTKKGITTSAYTAWIDMKKRCDNASSQNYKWYGGRGITYCARWRFFENFLVDMGSPPFKHELDRIDTNGNYEPTNCRWVTHQENCQNRRPREQKLS